MRRIQRGRETKKTRTWANSSPLCRANFLSDSIMRQVFRCSSAKISLHKSKGCKKMDAKKATDIKTVRIGRVPDVRAVLREVLYAAAAFALGRAQLPFGAFPFGFSALCASGGHAVSVFVGLCLSLIGRPTPLIYLAAYALTLLVRSVFCMFGDAREGDGGFFHGMFCEHISLRAVAAAVGAFGVGLYRLLASGFLYYDLFGAIIGIVAAALGAALLYPFEAKRGGDIAVTLSLAALACGVTWGLRGIGFYGVSLSAFFAMFASLTVTRKRGMIGGALVALTSGLCVSVSYAPLFVFGTTVYGFLSLVSPVFGAAASFAVGIAWGIYIDGIGAVSSLLPSLLASNFIFLTVDRLYLTGKISAQSAEHPNDTVGSTSQGTDVSVARLDDAAGRIKKLCEGFCALSDMLAKSDVDTELNFEIGELDTQMGDGFQSSYYGSCLADSVRSATLAAYMRAISEYLASVMVENGQSFFVDADMSRLVGDAVANEFPDTQVAVTVVGGERKRIMICSADARSLSRNTEKLRRAVSRACGFPVRCGDVEELDGRAMLTFTRDAVLEASFAGRKKCSADETEFCGDSFGIVQDNVKSFAYISDGMGSGREAAETSELCATFLEKLLPVNELTDDCVETTMKALNGLLCGRNGAGVRECAATVDLCALDLVGCRMSFYKSGAAPTYIFRDGSLFKVRSRTAPMGILQEADIGRINMELIPGDVIVMVSDGVTQGREECPELFDLLRTRVLTHSSEQLADAVMKYAEGGGCTDDVSVLVIKINEKDIACYP